jgi:thiamine-phosphate pyrophosphorylase
MSLIEQLELCLITDMQNKTISEYIKFIRDAIHGGVSMVQLREKSKGLEELKKIAIELQNILVPAKVPLIINDHVELAYEIDADGVHLGTSDMKWKGAREILGPDKIIGVSVESFEDIEHSNELTGNIYVAASAVFTSKTKLDCKKIWGLDGLKTVVERSVHPVIAIGDINEGNIKSVIKAGATGVAVISAIHDYKPYEASAELLMKGRSCSRK